MKLNYVLLWGVIVILILTLFNQKAQISNLKHQCEIALDRIDMLNDRFKISLFDIQKMTDETYFSYTLGNVNSDLKDLVPPIINLRIKLNSLADYLKINWVDEKNVPAHWKHASSK